jgi:hypothetical protein
MIRFMSDTGYRRFSATAPAAFLDEVTADIPKGKFSAWVYEAMRAKHEQDKLAELVETIEEESGLIDDELVERWRKILQ